MESRADVAKVVVTEGVVVPPVIKMPFFSFYPSEPESLVVSPVYLFYDRLVVPFPTGVRVDDTIMGTAVTLGRECPRDP